MKTKSTVFGVTQFKGVKLDGSVQLACGVFSVATPIEAAKRDFRDRFHDERFERVEIVSTENGN